jgi:hypothetical protein
VLHDSPVLVAIHIEHDQISIEQLGTNLSFVNRVALPSHGKQPVKHGDSLQLLENEYSYTIHIERTSSNNEQAVVPLSLTSNTSLLKRRNTNDDCCVSKKAKIILNTNNDESNDDNHSNEQSTDETRTIWLEEQLEALQARANPM